jgi:hypothetical protein
MADTKGGYTFLLWNGEYGSGAKFVVRDNANGKQTFFTPGDMQDITWASVDLTKSPDVKGWDGFENETVENLADVVF